MDRFPGWTLEHDKIANTPLTHKEAYLEAFIEAEDHADSAYALFMQAPISDPPDVDGDRVEKMRVIGKLLKQARVELEELMKG